MANQFLIKNTMADMRGLSVCEILSLQGTTPTYAGVELLGYYEKGDTPESAIYFLSNTTTTDNGGNVIQVGGVSLESPYNSQIDIRYFGAKGDGINDDTRYIQAAIKTKGSVIYFPTPPVNYKIIGSLQMESNQKFKGDNPHGKEGARDVKGLLGDGINPVIVMGGNGSTDRRLYCSLDNVVVRNTGSGSCVRVQHCHDFLIKRSRIHQQGTGKAVDVYFSYRANITENWIAGKVGVYAMDNVNGLTLETNTITGGTLGTAIIIGRSQGVWIRKNTIESSLRGICISSTGTPMEGGDPNDGSCSGISIDDNYIEACGTPILIGKTYRVAGGTIMRNTMGNVVANNPIPIEKMTGMICVGRLNGFSIKNNYLDQKNNVPIFDFWITTADTTLQQCDISDNTIQIIPNAGMVRFLGEFSNNNSSKRSIGGRNYIDFYRKFDPSGKGKFSSIDFREWISPVITANEARSSSAWIDKNSLALGGEVNRVEIVDKQGDISGCKLNIGYTNDGGLVVRDIDLGALTYSFNGTVILNALKTSTIFADFDNTYTIIKSAIETSTGTFRIKVTYRAT